MQYVNSTKLLFPFLLTYGTIGVEVHMTKLYCSGCGTVLEYRFYPTNEFHPGTGDRSWKSYLHCPRKSMFFDRHTHKKFSVHIDSEVRGDMGEVMASGETVCECQSRPLWDIFVDISNGV